MATQDAPLDDTNVFATVMWQDVETFAVTNCITFTQANEILQGAKFFAKRNKDLLDPKTLVAAVDAFKEGAIFQAKRATT